MNKNDNPITLKDLEKPVNKQKADTKKMKEGKKND